MKTKKSSASMKKVLYGSFDHIHSWGDGNFPAIRAFFSSNNDASDALLDRRPDVLTKILGPRHQVWVGGSDRLRSEIWLADAEGIPIWVLCNRRGTSYEMQHTGSYHDGSISPEDVAKFLRFLEGLFRRMQEVEPVGKAKKATLIEDAPGGGCLGLSK